MKKIFVTKPWDFWIFILTIVLVSLGIIMVFSASTPLAKNLFNNINHFLTRQLAAAGIGLVCMVFFSFLDYRLFRKLHYPILAVGLILLILVLIPGIGMVYNNARRWISIGFFEFQPSEVYKLCIIFFLAATITNLNENIRKFFRGVFPLMMLLAVSAFLLLRQPHLSVSVILVLLFLVMLFAGGARLLHFFFMGAAGFAGLTYIALYTDYMSTRIQSFLDPFRFAQDEGYQVVQSLYAIGSGGLFGRGLGRSIQKFLYIPEPHNDFIFSVMAEELGFFSVSLVIILFFLLTFRGFRTAIRCKDKFGSLLAMGISSLLFIQVVLNIAVVTGSVPPTGIALPLFSAGGTALVIFMIQIGILLNVSRQVSIDAK